MPKFFEQFLRDNSGAVSVEWVVITAGLIGMTVAVSALLETETLRLAADTGATVVAWESPTSDIETSD